MDRGAALRARLLPFDTLLAINWPVEKYLHSLIRYLTMLLKVPAPFGALTLPASVLTVIYGSIHPLP